MSLPTGPASPHASSGWSRRAGDHGVDEFTIDGQHGSILPCGSAHQLLDQRLLQIPQVQVEVVSGSSLGIRGHPRETSSRVPIIKRASQARNASHALTWSVITIGS